MTSERPSPRERPQGWRLQFLVQVGCLLLPLTVADLVLGFGGALAEGPRAIVATLALVVTVCFGAFRMNRLLGNVGTAFQVLGALKEGDYGFCGHVAPGKGSLQPLVADINDLSDALRGHRRKWTEASNFLGKTLTALRDPVFVIDGDERLLQINPAGRRLIGADGASIIGRDLASLGLTTALSAPDDTILSWHFATASGRWAVRRSTWYSDGRENAFVMLHDLSVALGEEERRAWQRLIRVLSHELNNSLAPIGSLATSLRMLIENDAPPPHAALSEGLEVIGRRAESLARFLGGYGRLARLPPPSLRPFRLDQALMRLVRLEDRLDVDVLGTAAITVEGDEDQLGQAFLNLLRNAVEASLGTGGGVRLNWHAETARVLVTIEDDGAGLPASETLFVPFFTTKPHGSGIGLSLTKLIVEAHAGSVDLENRVDATGVVATVRLPVIP